MKASASSGALGWRRRGLRGHGLESRPLHLAPEDAELVAEHQNLHLLGVLGAEGDDDQL
jgi:hypothetical protein